MNIDRQIMELRILLAHSVLEEEVLNYTARLKKLQHIKRVSSVYDDLYEPICDHCEYKLADVFEVDGDYCLECWKKHTHPDIQSPIRMTTATAIASTTTAATTTSSSSYLNKAVISLDSKPIGYVTGEDENNKMMIITDDKTGNKFIIPSCKVISVNERNTKSLIVDIEHREAVKYRIVEQQYSSQSFKGS